MNTALRYTLNPTRLGEHLGVSARVVNQRLVDLGLQKVNERMEWDLTREGMSWGVPVPYQRNGHSGYQILWDTRLAQRLLALQSGDLFPVDPPRPTIALSPIAPPATAFAPLDGQPGSLEHLRQIARTWLDGSEPARAIAEEDLIALTAWMAAYHAAWADFRVMPEPSTENLQEAEHDEPSH